MFHQFLQIVRSGAVQSQFEIAEKLNISPEMVVQIARDLTARGYLEGAAEECSPVETSGCSGCPAGSACHSSISTWGLTEKGKKAVSV